MAANLSYLEQYQEQYHDAPGSYYPFGTLFHTPGNEAGSVQQIVPQCGQRVTLCGSMKLKGIKAVAGECILQEDFYLQLVGMFECIFES